MILKKIVCIALILISFNAFSQDDFLIANAIPKELKENANVVVRYDNIEIQIKAYNRMIYKNKRIVTILNSSGNSKLGASMGYDNKTVIKKLEAKIYDRYGEEIKKINKSNFIDVSTVQGSTLYSDSRVKYLDYTPTEYPYTLVLETEVDYKTTAFIPGWRVIEGFYASTQNAEYKIINDTDIEVRVQTSNFENLSIRKMNKKHYIASNLKAIVPEAYSPSFRSYAPFLKAALTQFDMQGVKGVNNNWRDFGKWINDRLISDTQELSEGSINEIKSLTAKATSNLEKAKIVYEFVQNKTRYISVQVGIGGWKPIVADEVDRLGYGDCKGLSNYTKALLDHVGVESYYTVLYGGNNITNIDKEFSVAQGNHAILCVPNGNDFIWLECTNQKVPFGHIAGFTDDRDVLVVTPRGGKIVHTKIYLSEDSYLKTKAQINVDNLGGISADIISKSGGVQYNDRLSSIVDTDQKDRDSHYKEYWDYINGLSLEKVEINNDKDNIEIIEKLIVKSSNYGVSVGEKLLISPNVFNRFTSSPPRYSIRKLPFVIQRGFYDEDEYILNLPDDFIIDTLVEDKEISTQFGNYKIECEKLSDSKIKYKRTFRIFKGEYPKEEYNAYRSFIRKVIKFDKASLVIKRKI